MSGPVTTEDVAAVPMIRLVPADGLGPLIPCLYLYAATTATATAHMVKMTTVCLRG